MLGEGLRAGLAHLGIPLRTCCYLEREAYPASVLASRIQEQSLDAAPVWSDLLTFDARRWAGAVDGIAAGFPCQDLSLAGKRAGPARKQPDMTTPTQPKEHGFLFQEEMMRALLDQWSPKTVTRRLPSPTKIMVDGKGISAARWRAMGVNLHGWSSITAGGRSLQTLWFNSATGQQQTLEITPRVQPGDIIWAREGCHIHMPGEDNQAEPVVRYLADGTAGSAPEQMGHWISKPTPGLHMPRWAARYLARVTGVRFERLKDISHADAVAEGVEVWRRGWSPKSAAIAFLQGHQAANATGNGTTAQRLYYMLWEQINGRGSWDSNPIVLVYTFERIQHTPEMALEQAA